MEDLLKIEIAGKLYTCKFGMYAIKLIVEKRNISLTEFFDLFQDVEGIKGFDLLVDLIYAGAKNFQLINDKDEALNYYKLYDDFQTLHPDKSMDIMNAFMQTTINGKTLQSSLDELDQEVKESSSKKK
jgi:hypothetical protein